MNRLHQLMESLSGVDAALITNSINRRYYTGLSSSAGTLLAFPGRSVLIIDSRYFEVAQKNAQVDEVILQDKLYTQIGEVLQKQGAKTLAVESAAITLAQCESLADKLPGITLNRDNCLSDAINAQRKIKSEEEIAKMREAQRLTDDAFAYIITFIKAGMTERQVALELEFYGRKRGAEGVAFSFIVAAGANGSMPHAVPSDYVIQTGDFVTMDYGFVIDGYLSDMTRTVAVGEPGEKQRKVYQTVLESQLLALEKAKVGESCRAIDAAARDHIAAAGYGKCFGHGLGHSIGMQVHEDPRFSPESEAIFQEGCIMSVEPGIYLPGEFGVRIEDLIVGRQGGNENLTGSPKELIVL